jgi:hypothetical protein
MKNLGCCNFLIFHTILINDVSNKIVLNGLQFELILYLFLSSVFDKWKSFFFSNCTINFFAQFYRDFYFEYENVNNHAHAQKQKEQIKKYVIAPKIFHNTPSIM